MDETSGQARANELIKAYLIAIRILDAGEETWSQSKEENRAILVSTAARYVDGIKVSRLDQIISSDPILTEQIAAAYFYDLAKNGSSWEYADLEGLFMELQDKLGSRGLV